MCVTHLLGVYCDGVYLYLHVMANVVYIFLLFRCLWYIFNVCNIYMSCFLDIMYLVLLLFNDNLLILSHSLILDSSLLIYDVMFLLLSSLNESIVLESVVSSAYIMK